ncbi:MAG: DNA (cytosine-5-)-methyltransferase [Candidatus Actinomarinaceae bacterium]
MNVLSLFDGMSCGQIALNKLNIKYNKYYASEIDKYAIQITKKNYPNTIHLGDVTQVYAKDLPKIDLLIGGSPCQGFSFAGKQLAFDDPRSKLFFEFVRLLKELKPKYFLLENVRMKKEYLDIISEYLGVEPIKINSSLVSAQNRVRYYWTNILGIDQPKEKGIVLKGILQTDHQEQTVKDTKRNQRHYKGFDEKSLCLSATSYKGAGNNGMTLVPIQVGMATDINGHDILKRIYSTDGKSPTLNACTGGNREPKIAENKTLYRKLTTLECERLQTVPENYTDGVSNTQRYKMLGNGWTVDVITHIFQNMSLQDSRDS